MAPTGPVRFDFEVFGETLISREFMRIGMRAEDVAPAWTAIIEDMKDQIEEQFETEGVRGSGGWAPLKASTILFKERAGLDPRILHATLRLRESLTDERGSDQIYEVTPHTMRFGSRVEYGAYHQHGDPANNMPARKPIDFTEFDRQGYVRTLQRFIVHGELLREAG